LAEDAIQLHLQGRRIERSARHGYRCTSGGLGYQIDMAWASRRS
jgi:hypothetical protein